MALIVKSRSAVISPHAFIIVSVNAAQIAVSKRVVIAGAEGVDEVCSIGWVQPETKPGEQCEISR